MTPLKRFSYRLALVLGATVGQSTLAGAGTTDLFCHQGNATGSWGLNVSIDLDARKATAFVTGFKRTDVPAGEATITDDQVTWTNQISGVAYAYSLDRKSGSLTQMFPGTTVFWSCKRDTPVL